MFNIVIATKSKYAVLAALRLNLLSIFFEFLFAMIYLLIYFIVVGFNFNEVHIANNTYNLAVQVAPIILYIVIYVVFEAKRAPFDHSEAESELVAGHIIELGGKSLLFFYFSEYIHFFFGLFWLYLFVLSGFNYISIIESAYSACSFFVVY